MTTPDRTDYGLDAPGVVRNLFIAAAIGLLLWASVILKLWSGVLGGKQFRMDLGPTGLICGISFLFTGWWMIWDSKIGKLKSRDKLLDKLFWTGNEQVLDLGCGRGLLLVGAAKRLTAGKATGIDIWQTEDLSGNRPATLLVSKGRE